MDLHYGLVSLRSINAMSKEEATQCLKLRTLDDQVAEQLCELVDGRVFQVTDSLGNKVEKLDLNKIAFFIYTLKENIEIKTKGPRPHPHYRALRHRVEIISRRDGDPPTAGTSFLSRC
jgi:hypothetical protein